MLTVESWSFAGSCAASTTPFDMGDMGGTSADLSNIRNSSGLGPSQSTNKASIDTILVAKDPILETLPSHLAEVPISKSLQVRSRSCHVHGQFRSNPQRHQKCQEVFINYNEQSTICSAASGNSFKNTDSVVSNCSNKLTNQELFGKDTHEIEESNGPRNSGKPSNSCTSTTNKNFSQKTPSSKLLLGDGLNAPCVF